MTEERKFDRYLLTTFLIFVLCSIIRGVPFSFIFHSFRFQFQEGPLHSDFITREKTMLLLFIYLWSCTMICSDAPRRKFSYKLSPYFQILKVLPGIRSHFTSPQGSKFSYICLYCLNWSNKIQIKLNSSWLHEYKWV